MNRYNGKQVYTAMIVVTIVFICGVIVGLSLNPLEKVASSSPAAAEPYIPTVAEIQSRLEQAGYPLPRYGVDNKFGDETRRAMERYHRDHYCNQAAKETHPEWAP